MRTKRSVPEDDDTIHVVCLIVSYLLLSGLCVCVCVCVCVREVRLERCLHVDTHRNPASSPPIVCI